jgi:hypothetical protein
MMIMRDKKKGIGKRTALFCSMTSGVGRRRGARFRRRLLEV